MNTTKEHWENVYKTKSPNEVSWTQDVPSTSLNLIDQLGMPKDAAIIDIGGGDSTLVDHLLDEGYTDITVLDISAAALERAKARLGEKAEKVSWLEADVSEYEPQRTYICWHDRAALHFLTRSENISHYHDIVVKNVSKYLILATFSTSGPERCSALDVRQYDQQMMEELWAPDFELLSAFTEDHTTPTGNKQNFLYCSFARNKTTLS